ncbi:MAG: ribonuclease E inhibitor RraB [Tenacibaculum sp.]|nr:ribonuclease E inhibitor RraB [Tenacibaculum sp.]
MDIQRENIERIFKILLLQGVSLDNPLLYGYFFIDESYEKLEKLKEELVEQGYTFVSNEQFEDKDSNEFLLHLEKIENHSLESLENRLHEFNSLAEKFNVYFDGWDLGSSDPMRPLVSNEQFIDFLNSKMISDIFNVAEQLLENEIFDKSVIAFDKCINDNYKVEESLYKQFICYDYLNEPNQAIENLKKVIALNPQHFKAYFNVGAIAYGLQDYKTSLEFYKKAFVLDNTNDAVVYGISACQFCLGEMENAEKNCLLALQLNNNNENAQALLKIIKTENSR